MQRVLLKLVTIPNHMMDLFKHSTLPVSELMMLKLEHIQYPSIFHCITKRPHLCHMQGTWVPMWKSELARKYSQAYFTYSPHPPENCNNNNCLRLTGVESAILWHVMQYGMSVCQRHCTRSRLHCHYIPDWLVAESDFNSQCLFSRRSFDTVGAAPNRNQSKSVEVAPIEGWYKIRDSCNEDQCIDHYTLSLIDVRRTSKAQPTKNQKVLSLPSLISKAITWHCD